MANSAHLRLAPIRRPEYFSSMTSCKAASILSIQIEEKGICSRGPVDVVDDSTRNFDQILQVDTESKLFNLPINVTQSNYLYQS